MITPSDKDFQQTKQVKKHGIKLPSPLHELAAWIDTEYQVSVLNFYYDTFPPKDTPRLNVIFEFAHDAGKFRKSEFGGFDAIKQRAIREEFIRLLAEHGEHRFDTADLFVYFSAFEPIARQEANGKVSKSEIERLKVRLANEQLWEISIAFDSVGFFFFTDAQAKAAEASGLRKVYADEYARLVEPYDEFGYLKRAGIAVYFDSKENFDTNFESNWYYYYK